MVAFSGTRYCTSSFWKRSLSRLFGLNAWEECTMQLGGILLARILCLSPLPAPGSIPNRKKNKKRRNEISKPSKLVFHRLLLRSFCKCFFMLLFLSTFFSVFHVKESRKDISFLTSNSNKQQVERNLQGHKDSLSYRNLRDDVSGRNKCHCSSLRTHALPNI